MNWQSPVSGWLVESFDDAAAAFDELETQLDALASTLDEMPAEPAADAAAATRTAHKQGRDLSWSAWLHLESALPFWQARKLRSLRNSVRSVLASLDDVEDNDPTACSLPTTNTNRRASSRRSAWSTRAWVRR